MLTKLALWSFKALPPPGDYWQTWTKRPVYCVTNHDAFGLVGGIVLMKASEYIGAPTRVKYIQRPPFKHRCSFGVSQQ